MKYLVTLFWSVLLFQMVNFVLNSLDGGGPLDLVKPLVLSVVAVIFIMLFDAVIGSNTSSEN